MERHEEEIEALRREGIQHNEELEDLRMYAIAVHKREMEALQREVTVRHALKEMEDLEEVKERRVKELVALRKEFIEKLDV